MFKVKTSLAAKQDIREASSYYNGQQKGLGKRFVLFGVERYTLMHKICMHILLDMGM